MSILSPADRSVLWHVTVTSGADERQALLHALATAILDSAGRRLDLYGAYEDDIVSTVELLDASGLLGRDALRQAFEEADADTDRAEAFALRLADHLDEAADVTRLGADQRVRAVRLARAWRDHVLGRHDDGDEWLTAAEVAARFDVTTAAVYKWAERGRIEVERTPGGAIRIPAGQFERSHPRLDRAAVAEMQRRLIEHARDAPYVSDEDLADEVVDRRQR